MPATFQKLQINHNSLPTNDEEEDFDHGSYDNIVNIIVIYCWKNIYKLPDHYNLIVFDLSGNF